MDPVGVSSWGVADVCNRLRLLVANDYTHEFTASAVDGVALLMLDANDLKSLGVKALGDRKKILRFISDISTQESEGNSLSHIAFARSALSKAIADPALALRDDGPESKSRTLPPSAPCVMASPPPAPRCASPDIPLSTFLQPQPHTNATDGQPKPDGTKVDENEELTAESTAESTSTQQSTGATLRVVVEQEDEVSGGVSVLPSIPCLTPGACSEPSWQSVAQTPDADSQCQGIPPTTPPIADAPSVHPIALQPAPKASKSGRGAWPKHRTVSQPARPQPRAHSPNPFFQRVSSVMAHGRAALPFVALVVVRVCKQAIEARPEAQSWGFMMYFHNFALHEKEIEVEQALGVLISANVWDALGLASIVPDGRVWEILVKHDNVMRDLVEPVLTVRGWEQWLKMTSVHRNTASSCRFALTALCRVLRYYFIEASANNKLQTAQMDTCVGCLLYLLAQAVLQLNTLPHTNVQVLQEVMSKLLHFVDSHVLSINVPGSAFKPQQSSGAFAPSLIAEILATGSAQNNKSDERIEITKQPQRELPRAKCEPNETPNRATREGFPHTNRVRDARKLHHNPKAHPQTPPTPTTHMRLANAACNSPQSTHTQRMLANVSAPQSPPHAGSMPNAHQINHAIHAYNLAHQMAAAQCQQFFGQTPVFVTHQHVPPTSYQPQPCPPPQEHVAPLHLGVHTNRITSSQAVDALRSRTHLPQTHAHITVAVSSVLPNAQQVPPQAASVASTPYTTQYLMDRVATHLATCTSVVLQFCAQHLGVREVPALRNDGLPNFIRSVADFASRVSCLAFGMPTKGGLALPSVLCECLSHDLSQHRNAFQVGAKNAMLWMATHLVENKRLNVGGVAMEVMWQTVADHLTAISQNFVASPLPVKRCLACVLWLMLCAIKESDTATEVKTRAGEMQAIVMRFIASACEFDSGIPTNLKLAIAKEAEAVMMLAQKMPYPAPVVPNHLTSTQRQQPSQHLLASTPASPQHRSTQASAPVSGASARPISRDERTPKDVVADLMKGIW